jgi:hypothetical protein
VRAGFTLDTPANAEERGKNAPRPFAHDH